LLIISEAVPSRSLLAHTRQAGLELLGDFGVLQEMGRVFCTYALMCWSWPWSNCALSCSTIIACCAERH
jgi:hypothetical protein